MTKAKNRRRVKPTSTCMARLKIPTTSPVRPATARPAFVADGIPLPYIIGFENDATATAPAQSVTVTQQLDPNLDWSTFQLGDFGFGGHVLQGAGRPDLVQYASSTPPPPSASTSRSTPTSMS